MNDPKQEIITLLAQIEKGELPACSAWALIQNIKKDYVLKLGQSSWNSFIGHRFQALIHAILLDYTKKIVASNEEYGGLTILTENEVKKNEILSRKLSIRYGDFFLCPDIDSVIAWINNKHPWESEILAIVSCKTSLRERIAQACYWKLKLLSSDTQKNIKVFLATTDNDNDFNIELNTSKKKKKINFNGKSRDRIIAEYELDGVYIFKDDFMKEYEDDKVKMFENIFDDIVQILKNL